MRRDAMPSAALGFRVRSGWAALVVLAGPATAPVVINRRRIDLAGAARPKTVQPYHRARHLPIAAAEAAIARAAALAERLAAAAVREVVRDCTAKGYSGIACGIGGGRARPPVTLAATLASHPLLHAAEGLLFREAVARGAADCGLSVMTVPERDLYAEAAAALHQSAPRVRRCVSDFGRALGPPWREDEKLASTVAWLVLVGAKAPEKR
jgi:hypothetical protein